MVLLPWGHARSSSREVRQPDEAGQAVATPVSRWADDGRRGQVVQEKQGRPTEATGAGPAP